MWDFLIPAGAALGTGLAGFFLGRKTIAGKPPAPLTAWQEIDRLNREAAKEAARKRQTGH